MKISWRQKVNDLNWIRISPIIIDNLTYATAGNQIICCKTDSGKLIWDYKDKIDTLRVRFITKYHNTILAVLSNSKSIKIIKIERNKGSIISEIIKKGNYVPGSRFLDGNKLYFTYSRGNNENYFLCIVNINTNKFYKAVGLPIGAGNIIRIKNKFYFASSSYLDDMSGLYELDIPNSQYKKIYKGKIKKINGIGGIIILSQKTEKEETNNLIAIDISTNIVLWEKRVVETLFDIHENRLGYISVDEKGNEKASMINLKTGTNLWESSVLVDETIFLLFKDEYLCVQSDDNFKLYIETKSVPEIKIESPEWLFSHGLDILNNKFIIGHFNEIICFEKK